MKATLEFSDDDEVKLRQYLDGPLAFDVLWDVDQHLRMQIKHGEMSEAVADALQAVRDYLHTSAAEHGISIDA